MQPSVRHTTARPAKPLAQPPRTPLAQLPNALTLSRVPLLGLIVFAMLQHGPGWAWVAFGAFLFGALTDGLDGYLARRFGWESPLGRFLDPLIDKVYVLGLFGVLLALGRLGPPLWPVALSAVLLGVLVVREVGISLLRTYLKRRTGAVAGASWMGKCKTVAQLASLCLLLLLPALAGQGVDGPLLWGLNTGGHLSFLLAWLLALWSGYRYVARALQATRALGEAPHV